MSTPSAAATIAALPVYTPKRVFQGFNELRALAALLVILHHGELFRFRLGMRSLIDNALLSTGVERLGTNGVHLFFTLSGFLITYLLCAERQANGTINIRHFYLRRVLRIWPLYYFVLGLAVVALPLAVWAFPVFFSQVGFLRQGVFWPNATSLPVLGFYTFIAPNIGLNLSATAGRITGASQGWSIGVEEQFYLLWPFLLMLPKKWFVGALVLLGAVCATFNLWGTSLGHLLRLPTTLVKMVSAVFYFQYMCLGAGAALLVFYNNKPFNRLLTWRFFAWCLVPITLITTFTGAIGIGTGVCYALLVAMLAVRPGIFNVKWLAHLGGISYGLYMYHVLVMYIVLCALLILGITHQGQFALLFYAFTLGLTYLTAYLSYHYLEARFLKLKHKFE